MDRVMRIARVQLPLLDPNYSALKANIPLGPGYLAASLAPYADEKKLSIVIMPREVADFGGDAAIAEWIVSGDFNLVGFTCYMWNVERSIWIAARLKERNPAIVTLAGGPEIAEDCPWLCEPAIDSFVIGEGEEIFPRIVSDLADGKRSARIYRAEPISDLSGIRSPYLAGTLAIGREEAVPFETARGCAFACTYCFYSKARRQPRKVPEKDTRDFFSLASHKGASEIYLLDPSFSAGSDLHKRLEAIRDANGSGILLHAEMNLESVDTDTAKLMKEAGFASVEAGLQSTNHEALAAVKRRFDEARFLRGADLIRGPGIKLITGVILGLPKDTLGGFTRTLDFLADHSLVVGAEIYQLAVLPGTRLRQDAARSHIEFMERPPYHVLGSPSFSQDDLIRAQGLMRERLGLELYHDVIPRFSQGATYISLIDIQSPRVRAIIENPRMLANNCSIVFSRSPEDRVVLKELARIFRAHNPFACIQLFLREDEMVQEDFFMEVSDLFFRPDHYIERLHSFDDDAQGRFGTRIFQLTQEVRTVRTLLESHSFVDPVLVYRDGTFESIEGFIEKSKPIIVADSSIPEEELSDLMKIYADFPEYLIISGENIAR
jgi:hypothetical protein